MHLTDDAEMTLKSDSKRNLLIVYSGSLTVSSVAPEQTSQYSRACLRALFFAMWATSHVNHFNQVMACD